LDGILVRFSDNKKNELNDFQSEKLDCVLDIPVDQINYLLGSLQDAQKGENVMHKVLSEPSMSMMFIGFACQSKEFSDVRIRRAFNMVVDRNLVVNQYLSGEGWPAKNGFIPPLDFFPNEDVQPLENNIEEARSLMSDAGYPNGKNFPELEVYVNGVIGDPNYNMTKGVIDQINEKLGTKIKVKVCTAKERDQAVASGKAKMWRAGWIADYPNPESFMSLFYSRNINKSNSTINSFRFRNQEFDAIFEQANKEQDETIRNQLFALCDQIIVNEGVVIPVLTEDFIVFLNDRVKNFEPNSLEILDFSNTFIRPY
jgi:peptide/nickel transport system substrate-binding protein